MKKFIVMLPVLLLLSGCIFSRATRISEFKERINEKGESTKKWYQISDYDTIPVVEVSGDPGKIKYEKPDGTKYDVERNKKAALIDMSGVQVKKED